jgi:hypothetical protein
MKRRVVSGVLCGLLTIAMGSGCGKSAMRVTPGGPCTGIPSKVLAKDGVRYLYIEVPDNKVVVVKLDAVPQAASATGSATPASGAAGSASNSGSGTGNGGTGGSLTVEGPCPCQEQSCIPMCGVLQGLAAPGANLCPAPPPPAAH